MYYVYIEQLKLQESSTDLKNALSICLASFFLFNMNFPKECSQTYEFLQLIAGIHTNFTRSRKKSAQSKSKVLNFYKTVKN